VSGKINDNDAWSDDQGEGGNNNGEVAAVYSILPRFSLFAVMLFLRVPVRFPGAFSGLPSFSCHTLSFSFPFLSSAILVSEC